MRSQSRLHLYLCLLFSLLFVPLTGLTQTFRGGISGTVTDTTGAAVPSAPVTLLEVDTGVKHETTTSSAGTYIFEELPLGKYSVTVVASGFAPTKTEGIVVTAGQIFDVPIKLGVASQNSTVVVEADSLSLDVATTASTSTLSPQAVQDIPINGRDYTQMVALTPGYSGYSGGQGFDGSINGARRNQVNWQLDGVDNNDFWHNEPAINEGGAAGISGTELPMDTIDSFSMQTLSLPEAGRNAGGTVNVTLKSGTNQFHGSEYYYNRNELFGKKNPFSVSKLKVRNFVAGTSLGAPIIRDRLFFFGSYEYGGYELGNTQTGTEPSQAYQAEALAALNKYNVPVNTVNSTLLANLWLPSALSGPASTGNYQSPDPTTGHSFNGSVKFDYHLNDKNDISVHFFSGEGTQTTPGSDQMVWYYSKVPTRAMNYAIVWNNQITSRFSNQVLLGVDYFRQGYGDNNLNFNPISLGFNTGVPNVAGAPNITFLSGTFDPIGLTPFEYRNGTTGHVTDDATWTVGAHQIRFGGEYRHGYVYEQYEVSALGTYNYTGQEGLYHFPEPVVAPGAPPPPPTSWSNDPAYDTATKALADFLAGYMATDSIARGNQAREVSVNSFGLFVQDTFKLSSTANLNYGIRYDYTGALYNNDKDLSIFTANKGIVFQGDGIPKVYPPPTYDFSPRAGITWQPAFLGGLLVRAGGGMYFDNPNVNVFLSQSVKNGGAIGLQGNPAGASPLFTLSGAHKIVAPGALYENLASTPALTCTPSGPCGVYTVNQNFKNAVSVNYQLNVQKELSHGIIAQLGYVGNIGRKEILLRDINQAALSTTGSKIPTAQQQITRPFNSQYPNYGAINSLDSIGNSNYNALQIVVKMQNWHNLSSQFYYVWSHSLDDGTNYRSALPQDSTNIKADYASSTYDIPNTFRANFNYNIPQIHNTPHWLTGGFELHSLLSFYGGAPVSIQSSVDNSGTGEGSQRAIQVASNPYAGSNRNLTNIGTAAAPSYALYWLNPSSFVNAPNGTFATSRRDQMRDPGYGDVDLSVFKTGNVTQKIRIQFRAEMFNLFNHNNYAPFTATAGTSLGKITSTIGNYEGIPGIGPGEPFNVQFAAKILF
jgi:hypothetical protein